MTLFQLSLFLFFVSGITIISYKNYATTRGWSIGAMYYSDANFLKTIAIASMIISAVTAFFYAEWYYVVAGLAAGWILSGIITALFRSFTQILAPAILLAAVIVLAASYII